MSAWSCVKCSRHKKEGGRKEEGKRKGSRKEGGRKRSDKIKDKISQRVTCGSADSVHYIILGAAYL
jgi:hypothetical protein